MYLSGNEALAEDVSEETRGIIDEFLRQDPELATQLQREPVIPARVPALKPDHELQTLDRARRRLQGYPYLLMFALMFSAMLFGRIVSNTSWDVSPRNFIVTAAIAATFWIAYVVSLWRIRANPYRAGKKVTAPSTQHPAPAPTEHPAPSTPHPAPNPPPPARRGGGRE